MTHLATHGVFVKRHKLASLIVDKNDTYRLYAIGKPTAIYHDKSQALKNYRRAIRGNAITSLCACNDCQSDMTAYGVRKVTATSRQANSVAYVKDAL